MPKHNKDRLFVTATEWKRDFGGFQRKAEAGSRAVPFDCCCLSLVPFSSPALLDGVLFELVALLEFVQKHGTSPVTGAPAAAKEIVRLKMDKDEGKWRCPLTYRAFTNFSKVVAVTTSGNVYSYEGLKELKTTVDPLDSTPFGPGDLQTIHDPDDAELVERRSKVSAARRGDDDEDDEKGRPNVRESQTALSNRKLVEEAKRNVQERQKSQQSKRKRDDDDRGKKDAAPRGWTETCRRVRDELKPLTCDLIEGSAMSTGATSRAATSTAVDVSTRTELRRASDVELMDARFRFFQKKAKRGYARLETTMGHLNFELRFDLAPRACENFLGLCRDGDYDDVAFHRVVRDFVAQAGEKKNENGKGDTKKESSSLWGGPFPDEIAQQVHHDERGVLSMANPGARNQNTSQFFVTFAPARHLDGKHTIFGKLVGGNDTLDAIELVRVDAADDHRPRTDVSIRRAVVFVDPVPDADALFEQYVNDKILRRRHLDANRTTGAGPPPPKTTKVIMARPAAPPPTSFPQSGGGGGGKKHKGGLVEGPKHTTLTIGK
eukprot:CAMPEP_0118908574 /NCGR_PEP_ID=MMETSP1166-20130328/11522_1 /TAXON_ID=1104430 /ORGANISM="Chrysoreinhardia sp, Strain CCMP3193" /LENGTH=547 /DNA_ID=CAMNT_0006847969 /DNA_START=70 /DNA_END=1710 /DNA_ORIENTATION=-